jgi:hypothetical protein
MDVITILESKDLSSFLVQEMMGSLMSHETRLKLEEGSMEHVFKTQNSFRAQECLHPRNHFFQGLVLRPKSVCTLGFRPHPSYSPSSIFKVMHV